MLSSAASRHACAQGTRCLPLTCTRMGFYTCHPYIPHALSTNCVRYGEHMQETLAQHSEFKCNGHNDMKQCTAKL